VHLYESTVHVTVFYWNENNKFIHQGICLNLHCHGELILQPCNAVCAVHNGSPYLVVIVALTDDLPGYLPLCSQIIPLKLCMVL
jgi:hypothetical protein